MKPQMQIFKRYCIKSFFGRVYNTCPKNEKLIDKNKLLIKLM